MALWQSKKGELAGKGKRRERSKNFLPLLIERGFWGEAAFAIAPIRSKPSRIYETVKQFAPEGDHIPFLLLDLFEKAERKDTEARNVLNLVRQFGKESGLFWDVETKKLEAKPGAPFRLMVDSEGLATNLTDVGYGISQVLPVLLESIIHKKSNWILLQQPEVHLHPRAQAALGSMLARLVSKQGKRLVVETHSDYILDRVRLEVARGIIKPEDIAILYFDRREGKTKVHAIEIDEMGNLVNPPEGYRRFFLEEELSLLSGPEK